MADSRPSEMRIVRRRGGGTNLDEPLGSLSPVLSRLCRLRGITTPLQTSLDLVDLPRPDILPNLQQGVALLYQALVEHWNILVLGDFDADGATSCAVCVRSLEWMGGRPVTYLLPNRFEYGYGLSIPVAELALAHQPDLIITVDNGINSIDAARYLRDRGVHLLITDHHQPGETLPLADAIINPKLAGDQAAGVHLAGVGVIYYLMLGLRARLDHEGWFAARGLTRPNMAQLLDLVALGTVADRVPLDHANRILVHQGLVRIRRGLANPGINALISVGKRSHAHFSSSDLGYYLGPRLNAAGRLGEMALGVSCLLTESSDAASQTAQALASLNERRRTLETDLFDSAMAQLEAQGVVPGADDLPPAVVLFGESWHLGLTGILSSRLNALFNRPVWVFTRTEEQTWRGSGRSVKGLHLFAALQTLHQSDPTLLVRFGGHAMAAGVTLRETDAERFAAAFTRAMGQAGLQASPPPDWLTDGALAPHELTLQTAIELRTGMPWGERFPEPLFDDTFVVVAAVRLAGKHLKFKLQPQSGALAVPMDAIYFNCETTPDPQPNTCWQMVYSLDINTFRGVTLPQLTIRFARPCLSDSV